MDPFTDRRWIEQLPGRFLWASFSAGLMGLLLVTLLLSVELLEGTRSASAELDDSLLAPVASAEAPAESAPRSLGRR